MDSKLSRLQLALLESFFAVGRIRIDPPGEIMANKLCALLARGEIRDLVDVAELDAAGFSVERALELAHEKDRGLTPAQLAWVLSQIHIGDNADIPGRLGARALREFIETLQARLARAAFPSGEGRGPK